MQLGTRWRFGQTPPNRLSAAVAAALTQAEHDLGASLDSVWTLTWLEGRAICELDDGTRVVERPDGSATLLPADQTMLSEGSDDDDDDGWLNA